MTTRKNNRGKGSSRGTYDYVNLLIDFKLNDQDTDWQELAACKEQTLELFFHEPRGNPGRIHDAAKEICRSCPVRQRCLDWACTNEIWHGVWGGLTASERRQYLSRKQSRNTLGS